MQQLLRELFAAHYRDVYGYLYSLTRDAALSEELAAETFLQAVRSIGRFRGEADGKTWLFSIARHCWYDHLRRTKRTPPAANWEGEEPRSELTPERCVLAQEVLARVEALLQEEPERTRGIVKRRLQGESFHEIAKRYGISENSARVIDHRARARLRRILQEEGYTDDGL